MKKLIIVIYASLYTCFTYGQKHVVSNPKENIIYYGIPNPLEILVEGYKCKDFIVSTDNGQIKILDNRCDYQITAANVGIATIKIVSKKEPDKVLGSTKLRVKNIPKSGSKSRWKVRRGNPKECIACTGWNQCSANRL